MPDCKLMSTCPFYSDSKQEMSEMTEALKDEYCHGDYALCGRYMAYKALERERKIENLEIAAHIH